MIEALIGEFAAIGADPAVRVVVLAGDGPALSAGHDLKELRAHRNDADRGQAFYQRVMTRCAELMQQIVALAQAGDRRRRGRRDGGGLPARRRLRSRDRRR